MMNKISLPLPHQVLHPLFFMKTDEKVTVDRFKTDPLDPIFSYEILYYHKLLDTSLPWETTRLIKEAEEDWHEIKGKLIDAFTLRSGDEIDSLMRKAIACFLMYLSWTNGKPANPATWESELVKMEVKPVNAEERMAFVLKQPSLFHSYKQLDQLFSEQMKHYAGQQAIQKSKVNKNSV
jgi:hypothetical protein